MWQGGTDGEAGGTVGAGGSTDQGPRKQEAKKRVQAG